MNRRFVYLNGQVNFLVALEEDTERRKEDRAKHHSFRAMPMQKRPNLSCTARTPTTLRSGKRFYPAPFPSARRQLDIVARAALEFPFQQASRYAFLHARVRDLDSKLQAANPRWTPCSLRSGTRSTRRQRSHTCSSIVNSMRNW